MSLWENFMRTFIRTYYPLSLAAFIAATALMPMGAYAENAAAPAKAHSQAGSQQAAAPYGTSGPKESTAAGSTSGAAMGVNCPPGRNQGTASSSWPQGPVGEIGTNTAIINNSGTPGSTGATRATTTSGATPAAAGFGGYEKESSGTHAAAVSSSGTSNASSSNASSMNASSECPPDSGADTSGVSTKREESAVRSAKPSQQDKPTSHSDPKR